MAKYYYVSEAGDFDNAERILADDAEDAARALAELQFCSEPRLYGGVVRFVVSIDADGACAETYDVSVECWPYFVAMRVKNETI